MNNKSFRDKLDSELKNIVFSDKSRNEALERAAEYRRAAGYMGAGESDKRLSGVKAWRESLRSFMDMELRIPVKPLVVALLITVSGVVYACVGVTRISSEDVRKSSINIVEVKMGGQADGLYKNQS